MQPLGVTLGLGLNVITPNKLVAEVANTAYKHCTLCRPNHPNFETYGLPSLGVKKAAQPLHYGLLLRGDFSFLIVS